MNKNAIRNKQKILDTEGCLQVIVDILSYQDEVQGESKKTPYEYGNAARLIHDALVGRYAGEMKNVPKKQKWKQLDIEDAIKTAKDEQNNKTQ